MYLCGDRGNKTQPVVRAEARIKLWIVGLRLIFMIFSPVREGF
jgi:hypothetical protein